MTEISGGKIKDTVEFRWRIRFADLAAVADGEKEYLQTERNAIKDEVAILNKLKNLRLGG